MSKAEGKALGLVAANAPGIDAYVGFNSSAAFTFDPNNRAVANEYDFIGVAEHEISEMMGRYGLGQNGAASGRYSPIDLLPLFLARRAGSRAGQRRYFSIDGGTTVINTFNGTAAAT